MRKAIVLAGGLGTRLRPYTVVFPKPMLPIGGRPILETILRQLHHYGFSNATLSLGYMSGVVQSYFEGSDVKGIPILEYFVEKIPLGTAGPVKAIDPKEENFLVMNGDILTTLDLDSLFDYHVASGALLTLAVRKADYQLPLGIIEFDADGMVKEFKEKPTVSHFDNVGIYVYSRKVLSHMRPGLRCDVNDLVNQLIKEGERVAAFRSEEPYYWIDIGRHGDYETANEEFDKVRDAFPFLRE